LSEPQEPEEAALKAVREWLGSSETPQQFRETWVTRPYRDATLVAPAQPKRGAPMFLVLGGVVQMVPSARTQPMEQHYEELVARQTG
jgi:hypothetical protein